MNPQSDKKRILQLHAAQSADVLNIPIDFHVDFPCSLANGRNPGLRNLARELTVVHINNHSSILLLHERVKGCSLDGSDQLGLQSARAGVSFFTASNEMIKGRFGDGQFNILGFEFIDELRQYVLRQNLLQRFTRQFRETNDARKSANQLW